MVAKIAVSAAIYAIDKPYDYRVPPTLRVVAGQRVRVPFGQGNRQTEGVVLSVGAGEENGLKPVLQVLDDEPLLDERMLRTAAFLRDRYFCTFYDAVKAILPAGVWFREQATYRILQADWQGQIHRKPDAEAVMQALADRGGSAELDTLRQQFTPDALDGALRYLLKKKLISEETNQKRRVSDKSERIAALSVSVEEAQRYALAHRSTAPLQAAVLDLMTTVGECSGKDICYFTGATNAVLNRLEKFGFLELRDEPAFRIRRPEPAKLDGPLVLNEEQQKAYEGLSAQLASGRFGVSLLYGVTGSGKTSVYIKLIGDCLRAGRSALLLVPEIALTPQLLSLFAAHFGKKTAVLHSSLRITERYDTWKRIRSGEATVVLGTRSAVFAPLVRPGLLILDEEQEHTYKSENSPRYHAREVAIFRAAQCGAQVVLGSATPSIESMYRAKTGVYQLYTLKNRFNRQNLPPVSIVDMKQELKAGNATAISEPLLLNLRQNLLDGRQSILFLNRRGTSRMVACVECGYVPTCPACTVNLTYHHANGRLMCHYCGHSEPLPGRCPVCGGHLKQLGFGTQKVQEQLSELLPEAQVLRMDADTISASHPHEELLRRFREEKIPILLGTQMVTKGLNFENVTLVGVLDADMSLYVGSYRAAETTFSTVTQVIGRAGRGKASGRAMIQTMTPKNPVIELAARQDYDAFYEAELPLRELRGCPPFRDLISLTFQGRQEEQVIAAARRFRTALAAQLSLPEYAAETVVLLGPAPAQVARINWNYRCRLTLSCKNTRPLRLLLSRLMQGFAKDKTNRGVSVFADVNGNE